MKRDIVWTTRFKKDEDNVLVLTLARTRSHSDLFGQ